MAVFQIEAKIPSPSDRFIIFIMVEITAGRICFSGEVGIGSLSHDLVAIPFITFLTSSSETFLDCLITSLGLVVDLLWLYLCDIPENLFIFCIFCVKKSEKSFANSSSDSASCKGFSEIFPVMLLNILFLGVFLIFYYYAVDGRVPFWLVVLCCRCIVHLERLPLVQLHILPPHLLSSLHVSLEVFYVVIKAGIPFPFCDFLDDFCGMFV